MAADGSAFRRARRSAAPGPMRGRFHMILLGGAPGGGDLADPVSVPLLDLVAQYQNIKDEVLAAMMAVIERQSFIMGPEVAQLEARIAQLSSARHCDGWRRRHRRSPAPPQSAGSPPGR